MRENQPPIPGLELPTCEKLDKPIPIKERVRILEQRVTQLEAEVVMLICESRGLQP